MEAKRISAYRLSYKNYPYKFEPKHPNYVSNSTYKKILKKFFKKLAYELITSGKEITLPSRLGSIQVKKYKQEKKKVDYYNTKKYYGEHNKKFKDNKKVIYHNNRITDGWLPHVHWSKFMKATFKNKRKWALALTRPNIRPNSYNKENPEVSLMPYFKKVGYKKYEIYNPYLKKNLDGRLKDGEFSTSKSNSK